MIACGQYFRTHVVKVRLRKGYTNMQSYIKASQVVLPGDVGGLLLKLDFMDLVLQKWLDFSILEFLIATSYQTAKFTEDFTLKIFETFHKINHLIKLFYDFGTVIRTAPFILKSKK